MKEKGTIQASKPLFLFFVAILGLTIGWPPLSSAQTFTVPSASIQTRTFEDPLLNHVEARILLRKDGALIESSDVSAVWFMDSFGLELTPISGPEFERTNFIVASWDPWSELSWRINGYSAFALRYEDLEAGTYIFEVETMDGMVITRYVDFPEVLELDPVASATLSSYWQPDGSLVLSWDGPWWDMQFDQYRVTFTGPAGNEIFVLRVDREENLVFLPTALLEDIRELGETDIVSWRVLTSKRYEAAGGIDYARSYSNEVPLLLVNLSQTEIVDLNYVHVATGVDFGPQDGAFDDLAPYNLGSVNNNGWTSFRTAFAFDLSSLPPGSTIDSAKLTLAIEVFEGQRVVEIHGYAGEGGIQLSDFAMDNLVASTMLEPLGYLPFSLDVTSFVADLVANDQIFAGFNVREEPANDSNFTVMNLNLSYLPVLTIEFSLAQVVDVTIKPGDFPNSINPLNEGKIPVAILSNYMFHAPKEVDTTSLTFGRTGNEKSLAHCSDTPEDANGDGLLDVVCHFNTKATGFQLGDTQGVLKGMTLNGVPMQGTDSVHILK